MEIFSYQLFVALIIASLVVYFVQQGRKRDRKRQKEMVLLEQNASIVETIARTFETLIAYGYRCGKELDLSVFETHPDGVKILDERLPFVPDRQYYYIQAPIHGIELVVFQGSDRKQLYVWKWRGASNAIKYGSNFTVLESALTTKPFVDYPESSSEAVGIMHELIRINERAGLGRFPYPKPAVLPNASAGP